MSARYDFEGFWLDVLRYHPLVRLPEFLLGIGLARLYAHPPLRTTMARHAGLLATTATALILGVLALGPRVPYVLLHNGLLAPAFALLLLALATGAGLPARLLARPATRSIVASILASGCSAGSYALGEGECDQSDSTVSCCLKQHPGEYERCAAEAPTPPQVQPNQLNPGSAETGQPESVAVPIPELPTAEEMEKRVERCTEYYVRCIEARGGKPGRVHNETQCKACFDACKRYGYWPLRANRKICKGG